MRRLLPLLTLAAAAMAVAGAVYGQVIHEGINDLPVKRAFANVAASSTDATLVAAVTARRIRVLGLQAQDAATTTAVTFNSKPAGAGTAISPLFQLPVNGGLTWPLDQNGWLLTNAGEGLSVTTGVGSTTGILVIYAEIP